MGRATSLRIACVLSIALASARAQADEPWILTVDGALAMPVVAPQSELFGPGAAASVSVQRGLTEWALIGLSARAGFLSDGPPPSDSTRRDPGAGDLFGLSLTLRLRPLAPLTPGPERATGLFVELGGGGALTGGLVRPSAEAALGWGFSLGDVVLAPFARWWTIFELDNQLDARPAHVLMAGVELAFFDARPAPVDMPDAPIGDRDADGLRDDVDGCTDEPEDADGFEDEDGCPDADDDRDGVLDADDACRLVPEDRDGFEDEDGCPDADDDRDGFADAEDACPREPEVINGVDDRDGCPDEGLIALIDDRIVLEERVLFDLNRARVKHRAFPILDAIAALYRQHPEWVQLRVEGHADVRGAQDFNQRLSELRARQVVRALVERGIPAGIIDGIGYGETRPRAAGHTEEIHQLNRRVEFVVMARRELTSDEHAREIEARRRALADRRAGGER